VWWGNMTDGSNLEEQGVDSRIILKWILKTGQIDLFFFFVLVSKKGLCCM
jgi:hypothetical protein